MREFDKWVDRERPAHQWQKANYREAAKEGWKAALVTIKGKAETFWSDDVDAPSVEAIPVSIIDEELGNE